MNDAKYKRSDDLSLEFVEGERAVIGKITTNAIDRDREIVLPSGGNLKNFLKNPVVLFIHDGQRLPVGRCMWMTMAKDQSYIRAKTAFANSPIGIECWELYKAQILRAFSISFRPDFKTMGPPTPQELKVNPDWADARNIVRKWEMLEYSIVPLPCNPEALVEAVSKGWKAPKWLPMGGIKMDDMPITGGDDDGDETPSPPSRADTLAFHANMIKVAEGIVHSHKKGIMCCKAFGKQAHWQQHADDVNDAEEMGYHSKAEIEKRILVGGAQKAIVQVGRRPEGPGWQQVHPAPANDNGDKGLEDNELVDKLDGLDDSIHPQGDFEFARQLLAEPSTDKMVKAAVRLWGLARKGDESESVQQWLAERERKGGTITDDLERLQWGLSFDGEKVAVAQVKRFAHLLSGALSVEQVKAAKAAIQVGLSAEQVSGLARASATELIDQLRGKI